MNIIFQIVIFFVVFMIYRAIRNPILGITDSQKFTKPFIYYMGLCVFIVEITTVGFTTQYVMYGI